MLSDRNIREINNQIARELRTAESICSTPEEKLAAIERVVKLKELLAPIPEAQEPLPSRKTLLKELAAALLEARTEHRQAQEPRDIFDAIFGTRR